MKCTPSVLFISTFIVFFQATLNAKTTGVLELRQAEYITSTSDEEKSNSYSEFSALINFNRKFGSKALFNAHLGGVISLQKKTDQTFFAPELYHQFNTDSHGSYISVGRKIADWSSGDNDWKLSLWQPNFRWDYLNSKVQGLTGFLWHQESKYVESNLLIAPMFIPEQGPNETIERGQIFSSSRWVQSGAESFRLANGVAPIEYSLNRPEIADVVNHFGVGASIKLKSEQGLWFSMAYAYKPKNQWRFAVTNQYFIVDEVNRAEITPLVTYHRLAQVEMGHKYSTGLVYASYINENPIVDELKPDWEFAPYYLNKIITAGVEQNLAGLDLKYTTLNLSYFAREKALRFSNEQGLLKAEDFEVMDEYFYKKAIKAGLKQAVPFNYSQKISVETNYIYDLDYKGSWLNLSLAYEDRRSWKYFVTLDVLGVATASDSSAQFFSRFRENDRILGGATYVF